MKKILTTIFTILVIVYCFSAQISLAVGLRDAFYGNTGDSSLNTFANNAGYDEGVAIIGGPEFYIGLALNLLFSLVGIILIGLIIYSGIVWMTARGDEAKVTKAKDTLTEAIIGLLFILGGYALSIFLLNVFT